MSQSPKFLSSKGVPQKKGSVSQFRSPNSRLLLTQQPCKQTSNPITRKTSKMTRVQRTRGNQDSPWGTRATPNAHPHKKHMWRREKARGLFLCRGTSLHLHGSKNARSSVIATFRDPKKEETFRSPYPTLCGNCQTSPKQRGKVNLRVCTPEVRGT